MDYLGNEDSDLNDFAQLEQQIINEDPEELRRFAQMFKTKSPEVLRNMDPETFNDLDLGSFVDPGEPAQNAPEPKPEPIPETKPAREPQPKSEPQSNRPSTMKDKKPMSQEDAYEAAQAKLQRQKELLARNRAAKEGSQPQPKP